jgi:hypothetical protein
VSTFHPPNKGFRPVLGQHLSHTETKDDVSSGLVASSYEAERAYARRAENAGNLLGAAVHAAAAPKPPQAV